MVRRRWLLLLSRARYYRYNIHYTADTTRSPSSEDMATATDRNRKPVALRRRQHITTYIKSQQNVTLPSSFHGWRAHTHKHTQHTRNTYRNLRKYEIVLRMKALISFMRLRATRRRSSNSNVH